MENTRLINNGEPKTLLLIVRDTHGRIAQQAIGPAIVGAEIDEVATPSALRDGLLALACFRAHSPRQAAAAMRELADLGDVDSKAGDFAPPWFQPDDGISVIDRLLERKRRPFAGPIRAELGLMRRALTEAGRRGCRFYLLDPEPGERLGFERIQLAE